jgi:hypothetical protein
MLIFSITTCTPTRTFSGATKIRGQTVYTVHVSSSPKSRQWIAVIAADLLGKGPPMPVHADVASAGTASPAATAAISFHSSHAAVCLGRIF